MSIDRGFLVLWLMLIALSPLFSQKAKEEENIYKINRIVSASIGVAGSTASYFGIKKIREKADIPEEVVLGLDKYDVNSFDRRVLFQDPEYRQTANDISDIGRNITFFAPVLLLSDKKIRKHWLDIGLLYFETQAISSLIYTWSPLGPQFIDRYRPETYYDEISLKNRQSGQNRNSFFSGHTIVTSTASFFMAKVICDFHPELGGKKWMVYGAALIPPAFIGYFRMRALRHFPTDTIAAIAIGATMGFLIPHLHKKKKDSGVSIDTNIEGNGIALKYRF
jgi:hypothetical protein